MVVTVYGLLVANRDVPSRGFAVQVHLLLNRGGTILHLSARIVHSATGQLVWPHAPCGMGPNRGEEWKFQKSAATGICKKLPNSAAYMVPVKVHATCQRYEQYRPCGEILCVWHTVHKPKFRLRVTPLGSWGHVSEGECGAHSACQVP
jgi:hypothetical protein